ncbi:CHASE2 domain-containing protein [Thermodesulfobacteriota bacterium]
MNTSKKKNIQFLIILIFSSFVAAHLCLWLLPDIFETWNARFIDQLFLFRSNSEKFKPHYDDTIVHVDLNNTSIQQLNNFYLNRSHHAQVVRNLSAMRVAAQLYDFIFAAPSNDEEDRALITAVSDAGNVYFGLALELRIEGEPKRKSTDIAKPVKYLDKTNWKVTVKGDPSTFYDGEKPLITFPALASASKGLGYLNIISDSDGVFRRVPLLVRYKKAFYPSFPLRAICDYLSVPPDKIIIEPGKTITLTEAKRPGKPKEHDIVIPIDCHGNMRVNFIGPWERMKHYNFSDVLNASEDRDELEMWKGELSGKIVIVSEVKTGSSDVGSVPTDANLPLSGLHANVMHSILTGSFIKELSYIEMLLIELLLSSTILIMSLRFSSLPFSIGTITIGLGYLVISALFFMYGQVILHIIRPLLIVSFSLVSILVYRYINEEKEKEVLRRSFEAYFPPLIVKKIMANPKMIASRGQKKELTIMFSDIVNFTGYSANMDPDHVQKLLNEYFELMTEIVFKHEGTVDKFMGDGLMVFFGDPESQPDHAVRCVKAAVEMQQKVREIKTKWEEKGDMPIEIRIGINTGIVVVGNMGSQRRLSYTVLGADVNLAQRLESSAPVGGILISKRTNDLVKDHMTTKTLGSIQVKGFDEPVAVYEVPVDNKPVT